MNFTKKIALLATVSLFSICSVNAQMVKNDFWDLSDDTLLDGKTIIKANMLGWTTRNFGFYGERIVFKNISVVLGVNFMPQGSIPYINKFTDEQFIRDIRVNSFSITPEVRFYLSKSEYGKGFYIAPYYKYERFHAENFSFEYDDNTDIKQAVMVNGDLNTHSFGAAFGAQWFVGRKKNIAIDWTIIGVHYGSNKGVFEGISDHTLSAQEQAGLKQKIEKSFNDLKMGKKQIVKINSIDVGANSVKTGIESPWALFRMALSIGYRF